MILYILAMIGGFTIIASILVLFAYMLSLLEKEGRK